MKKFFLLAGLGPLFMALVLPLGAQDSGKNEGITRDQAERILDELRQIRQLLEKQQAKDAGPQEPEPVRAKLNLQGAQMLGDKDAPITMVEFTDFQCSFCQRFHLTTFGELKKNYIDTGKVRFFSRDMPLDFHPDAMRAAQAGKCAAEQNQFWAMRDVMATNPNKLDMASILSFAAGLKLDTNKLRSCIESEKHRNAVQTDIMEAMKIGVNGTPSFVVGKSTPEGVDGELIVGALPYQHFQQKLDELQ